MQRYLIASILPLALIALSGGAASAEDLAATHDYAPDGPATTGIVSTLGPQVGLNGPPHALKVQAAVWHAFTDQFAFVGSLGMAFGGETTFAASDPETPDATYESTVGAEFAAGVRYLLDFGDMPFDTYVRGTLAVDVTGGEELIGYMVGPAAAIGLAYPVAPGLSLVADVETGFGFGQYKAAGSVFALTLDALVGAQIAF